MKIKMISDKVLIKQEEGTKEIGGLQIAEKYVDKPKRGVVVAVGEGYVSEKGEFYPTVCKVGDIVVYQQYANNTVEIDGVVYVVMREIDIHFILN